MDNCPRCELRPGVLPVEVTGGTALWCDACAEEHAYTCDRCGRVYGGWNFIPPSDGGDCWNCRAELADILFDQYMDRL